MELRQTALDTRHLFEPPAAPPVAPAHVIASESEALEIARTLAGEFRAGASDRDRERRLPWSELDRFSRSGLWGITVPRTYGGAGVSNAVLAEVIATISAADGSLGQIPQNHFYALEVLRVGGSPEQQQAFFARTLAGERFGNALAEIGARDFQRRTRLLREAEGWFLEGDKFYCTGALYAHWIPTLAMAEEEGGLVSHLVFVPREAEGVEVVDDWDGFGQRTTGSGTVRFRRVRVEPDWVVPFGASFERATTIGPVAQIMHAAIDLGIGREAYADMLAFVKARARPWIDSGTERAVDDPLTIREVGEVHVRLRAAEALLRRAGRIVDQAQGKMTEDSVAEASIAVAEARIATTKAGLLAATKLFELSGTSSTLAEDNHDRHWRNVRTHTLHDPVRWKYQAVGRYHLTGKRPPRHGAL
ncbi:SfnB family sulfur acquisition oxidoreductase [Aureimonas sp. AU40]|uniref:SfnB family sulfur acquisition oxidoreductase n=1 Tax=Aureimonas sp. AU40 TaxID=1637747 RepID=UPI000785479F